MKNISEYKIEQYLRHSHELSENEVREIEAAIQTSEEARKIYEFLKDYYAEFDKRSGVQTNIISLKATNYKNNSGPVVLAAMTAEKSSHSLLTKATLVSEEHKTLVRVLEDQKDQSLQFHILSGQINDVERAIISLTDPDLDLVTDDKGKLKNVRELSDIHWNTVSTLLRLPIAKTTIKGNNNQCLKHVLDSEIWIQQKKEKLILEVKNPDIRLSRVLLVQDGIVNLQRFEENQAEFGLSGTGEITLYFYE